jgi:serine/threonine protein kinase
MLQHDMFLYNIDDMSLQKSHCIDKMLKIEHHGIQDYAIYHHTLGRGSYSRVSLAQNIKTLEWLAVKIQPYSDPADIQHEIKHLSLAKDYRGDTMVSDQKQKMHYLFMRLARGTAVEKLYEKNLQYSTEEIFNIIISSFYALQELHQKNIVHNDIHEGNLIYNPSNKKSQWVDMAFSIKLKPEDKIYHLKHINKHAAFCYNAPESTKQRGYTTDIYQLGFISLRLLLILSEQNSELRKKYIDSRSYTFKILKAKQKMLLSTTTMPLEPAKNILSLLYRMIDSDVEKRPTLVDAIREFNINLNKFKLTQQFSTCLY